MFCLFLTFKAPDVRAFSPDEHARLAELLGALPGIGKALVMTPAVVTDRYYDDGPPPMLMVQAYFATLQDAEAAMSARGGLALLTAREFPSLAGVAGTHQVMWTRPFAVPGLGPCEDGQTCAFMVHYDGRPEDANAWHGFYLRHHPQIMTTFPEIREVEVYTPVEWIDELPWTRATSFQRNKVVFDTPDALEAALNSPVREKMKEDRAQFPPFDGGSIHVAMICKAIV